MVPEITSAVIAAREVFNAISSFRDLANDGPQKEAVMNLQNLAIDLQSKVFVAQSQFQDLVDSKRAAESKLAEMENWKTEAEQYRVIEAGSKIFVYAMKEGAKPNTTDNPWLCPKCFGERKKAMLIKLDIDNVNYHCTRCDFEIIPSRPSYPGIESEF